MDFCTVNLPYLGRHAKVCVFALKYVGGFAVYPVTSFPYFAIRFAAYHGRVNPPKNIHYA